MANEMRSGAPGTELFEEAELEEVSGFFLLWRETAKMHSFQHLTRLEIRRSPEPFAAMTLSVRLADDLSVSHARS